MLAIKPSFRVGVGGARPPGALAPTAYPRGRSPALLALILILSTFLTSAAQGGEGDGAALRQQLQAVLARGDKQWIIPPGDYRFDGPQARDFVIADAHDLAIDARGATFWFNPRAGVRLLRCSRLSLRGLTIDTDPLPWWQARITGLDPGQGTIDAELEPGFDLPAAVAAKAQGRVLFFDPQTTQEIGVFDTSAHRVERLEGNRIRLGNFSHNRPFLTPIFPRSLRVGDRMSINDERGSGGNLRLQECGDVTVDGVAIYGSGGFAFNETSGPGGNIYRNCRLVRRPGSSRLIADRSDGFHSTLMRRGPIIEHCEFSFACDDLLAIQGFFAVVLDHATPRELLLACPYGAMVAAGAHLRGYRLPDGQPVAEAEVESAEAVRDPAAIGAARALPKRLLTEFKVRIRPMDNVAVVRVKLDRDIPVKFPDVVDSFFAAGEGSVIRENHVHDGHIRGILVKSHDTTIEDNLVERIANGGIVLEAELFWLEGPFNSSARVTGNRLVDIGWAGFDDVGVGIPLAAIQVGGYFGRRLFPRMLTTGEQSSDIVVSGNTIVHSAAFPIWIRNTAGAVVTNNRISAPFAAGPMSAVLDLSRLASPEATLSSADRETLHAPYYAVLLQNVTSADVQGNSVAEAPAFFRGPLGSVTLLNKAPFP